MAIILNIRCGGRVSIPIEVSPEDTVHIIKLRFCSQQNLDPKTTSVRVLFQGKELGDADCLEKYDFADQTVLHAILGPWQQNGGSSNTDTVDVRGAERLSVVDETVKETNTCGTDRPTTDRCSLYYVYCKPVCRSVQTGRLRVRCAKCKQGTLKVHREPEGWSDVLHTGQIKGECLQEGCLGDTAEFYFKCNGHRCGEDDMGVVILQQITANLDRHPCITCCDITKMVLIFHCQSSHLVCVPCFEEYCMTRLNERGFVYSNEHGYTLGCPAGCEDSLIEEAHHFRILGEDQYDRYQRFATEECILREGGVICPAPGCGEGFFPGDVRRVQCVRQGCRYVFCRHCNQPYHDGECDLARVAAENTTLPYRQVIINSQNLASLETITMTTKPCPKCTTPTEKDGGCMHMQCSRCKFDWCWICHKEWTRDCQGDHWFG